MHYSVNILAPICQREIVRVILVFFLSLLLRQLLLKGKCPHEIWHVLRIFHTHLHWNSPPANRLPLVNKPNGDCLDAVFSIIVWQISRRLALALLFPRVTRLRMLSNINGNGIFYGWMPALPAFRYQFSFGTELSEKFSPCFGRVDMTIRYSPWEIDCCSGMCVRYFQL